VVQGDVVVVGLDWIKLPQTRCVSRVSSKIVNTFNTAALNSDPEIPECSIYRTTAATLNSKYITIIIFIYKSLRI